MTPIANLGWTVIGQMLSLFVRRKKVKVTFVGQIASVQDTVICGNAGMEVKEIDAMVIRIANLGGVDALTCSVSLRGVVKKYSTS